MRDMKIALGADHGGYELKEAIKKLLDKRGIPFEDFGCHNSESCDYPIYGKLVAEAVSDGSFTRGILVCGSGIGMSIVANKIKGIRAALCWNLETATSARTHNNSNILCLGQRQLDMDLALQMVNVWLDSEFEGGRHKRRVENIEG